jgi:hypothetical protein
MVGDPFVVQMSHARHVRRVALPLRPVDSFALRPERAKHVIRMVLNHIVVDVSSLRPALWPSLNVNSGHDALLMVAEA